MQLKIRAGGLTEIDLDDCWKKLIDSRVITALNCQKNGNDRREVMAYKAKVRDYSARSRFVTSPS